MGTDSKINRREFIKRSAAGGASATLALGADHRVAAATNQESPNGRISVGFIGTGARGQELMMAVQQVLGAEIVAVCDAYRGRQERAVERTKGRAKIYHDHRELLAAPGIDAVVIATPDHLHKMHALAALEAGKDVYIEKPMTYTVGEGLEIIAAVKKTGRIFQVGSQGISSPIQGKAKELIASGKLGQVTMIRASYNRNTAGGAWIYPIPPDASPQTVDWDQFLGPAPRRPFNLEHFFRWRCYQAYSGGIATDLFVHLMTTIHYVMGAQMPESVVALGELYRWRSSRDVPDTLNAILQYPEGFTVNLSATFNNQFQSEGNVQILGTRGTLQLGGGLVFTPERAIEDNGWIVESWPKALEEAYYQDPKVQQAEMPRKWAPQVVEGQERWNEVGRETTVVHFENFFAAVRSRRPPVEDALVGHRAASVAHLINLSAKQKKIVSWDRSRDNLKA
jgi:predicted dehydrogenase